MIILKRTKLYTIQTEKQQKFLQYHLVNLKKYGYLIGEDLGYKPGVFEKNKFDYSPLGKDFNKGLHEKDKKADFWMH